jgi:hypothetical protein
MKAETTARLTALIAVGLVQKLAGDAAAIQARLEPLKHPHAHGVDGLVTLGGNAQPGETIDIVECGQPFADPDLEKELAGTEYGFGFVATIRRADGSPRMVLPFHIGVAIVSINGKGEGKIFTVIADKDVADALGA